MEALQHDFLGGGERGGGRLFWLDGGDGAKRAAAPGAGAAAVALPPPTPGGGAVNALLTRMHVHYDAEHFPEDLMFQETADRQNFQARYVMRHPFLDRVDCDAGRAYREQIKQRREKEAQTLAPLTSWPIESIRK